MFFGLAALSVWLLAGEWRAAGFSAKADISMLNHGELPSLALSTSSDTALLDGCLTAVSSVEGRLLPWARRGNLLAQCLQISKAITASSRYDAYGWFAQAYFARETGDFDGMNAALERSYQTGPNEQWLAALRVRLAEQNFGYLDGSAKLGHGADLALMVQSPSGGEAIALRYIRDANFRERIKTLVEVLPERQQQAFISTLRGITRNSGNG